jgi:hypothetical protein
MKHAIDGRAAPQPRGPTRHWPNVLLFVLVAALLMYVQWMTNAHKALHELGDFSANGFLILDAKHLHLLYGNYSRIGVHHPGPAILYVLAFGEALFHDLLRVVPSPFSGQLMAVCLYSAAWIVLIFAMLRRIAGGVLPALMFTAVFTAALGFFEAPVYLGAWMPDLYILPFAAVLVAISRLAHGRTDMLRALAVSSGFVINGHVSFIPMLGVMLVAMLAANWAISRRDPAMRILSPAFLVRHRRDILVAVGILLLFFVPLLILTVTEFPGPLYGYAKFGGTGKHNALRESLKFVGFFWTKGHAWAWGLLAAALLLSGVRAVDRPLLRDLRALGIAFLAASLALLVYAKFGIDHLALTYVGLFYYAVPALAAALVLLYAWQALGGSARATASATASASKGRALAAGLVTVAGLVATWQALHKPGYYDFLYDMPGIVQMHERLRALPGSGRIVLDLEQEGLDWDEIWGKVAALRLYGKRQGQDLYCVNEHWHLLFTNEGRCRPEELGTPRRFFVRNMSTPDAARGDADIEGMGLLLYRHGRTDAPLAYTRVGDSKDVFRAILGSGWSDLEADYVWSLGPVAEIRLPADPARGRTLRLDVGSFIPEDFFRQHLDVLVNGRPAGGWDFNHFEIRRQIRVDLGPDPGAAQHIVLRIAHPAAPADYPSWPVDGRKLGVSLYGMQQGGNQEDKRISK